MREIKFRARTVETGEWIYFALRDLEQGKLPSFIWETVCQFTGLLDRHGKEIYEEDILRTEFNKSENKNKKDKRSIGIVKWSGNHFGAGFSIFEDEAPVDYDDEWKNFEIIGNIYENSNLLQ